MSDDKIQLLKNKNWINLEELRYKDLKGGNDESELQKLIFDNPSLLKKDFLVLCREFQTESGPVDAIGVDKSGNFFIIEVKLNYNNDKRKIIGQIIDYGGSILSKISADKKTNEKINEKWFKNLFERIQERIDNKFEDIVKKEFSFSKDDYNNFFENFKQNLIENKAVYYIVMDEIDEKLVNNVRLLHSYTNPMYSIILFEIKKYRQDDSVLYASKRYEFELPDDTRKSSKRTKWNKKRFFEALDSNFDNVDEKEVIVNFYDWANKKFDNITFGTGSIDGSANMKLNKFSKRSVFTLWSKGTISFQFGWLDDTKETITKTNILREKIEKLFEGLDTIKYPSVKFEDWKDKVDEIQKILGEVLELK